MVGIASAKVLGQEAGCLGTIKGASVEMEAVIGEKSYLIWTRPLTVC